jgi:hypothetical protein
MTAGDLRRDRWDAASYRCPCGFDGDDAGEFDRHLDAADGAGTEHFEVLDGWTLEQVRRWQATAGAPGKPGAALASPVLTSGSGVFDGEGRPYVVRMELPLSAEQMVAALYGDRGHLMPDDVGTDERVWANAAVAVVQDGLAAVEQLARQIQAQEASSTLAAPGWLALCRRRVAEMAAVSAGLRLA